MTTPTEARTAATAALGDPEVAAHVRRVADRHRRRHPTPPPARTAAAQWHDFAVAETAIQHEQERHR